MLEKKKGGLPRLLFGGLGWTIGLVVGVSRNKGRVIFQVTVNSQNRGKWPEIHVKPSCIENLRHQAAIGQAYIVSDAVFSGARCQQFFHRWKRLHISKLFSRKFRSWLNKIVLTMIYWVKGADVTFFLFSLPSRSLSFIKYICFSIIYKQKIFFYFNTKLLNRQ